MDRDEHQFHLFLTFIAKESISSFAAVMAVIELAMILVAIFALNKGVVGTGWFLASILLLVGTSAFLLILSWKAFRRPTVILPRIRAIKKSTAASQKDGSKEPGIIFLLDGSELFSSESVVEIYLQSNEYEEFVGLGIVASIQTNGLIQVRVLQLDENRDELLDCHEWDRERIRHLIVKPTLSRPGHSMIETISF